ncbi:hypothetical protein ACFC1B_07245 [Streptomyces xiamenensis]|uniref:hypothetical protein n=1 Tax=Streptomyces xiamenensis TaxID=408015 RepID=UPI0035D7F9BD
MSARRDLRAALEETAALRRQLAAERAALEDAESRLAIGGRQYSDASDRIVRQATELCELRAELASTQRQLAATQRQLDDATGMDDPAVEAGAQWQSRREDLPAVPQPITPAPRRPLPRRTSAETAARRLLASTEADLDDLMSRPA